MDNLTVRRLSANDVGYHASALADVLLDCVDAGASVGFMSLLSPESARSFRDSVAGSVARDEGK